ncbi:MAG: hypothetical protein ACHQK9_25850, partial [Reyranellales bacterium]
MLAEILIDIHLVLGSEKKIDRNRHGWYHVFVGVAIQRFYPGGSFMRRSKDGSQKKLRGKALGVVGVSFALAGAACAESSPAD